MSFVTSMTGIDWDQEQYERDLRYGLLPDTPEVEYERAREREERLHLHDFSTTMRALRVPTGAMDRRLAAPVPVSPPLGGTGAATPSSHAKAA